LKALRAAIPQDKASMLKIEENYDEAIQKYNEAIQYSERASYYTDRGDCYYNLNDYRRALADYNQALDLSPNNTDYLRRKAGVLYKLKRFTDAQETIEMAARLDPNDKWIQKRKEFYESDGVKAYTHSYNAATLMEGQRYEEAIIELNEAIKTNPDEPVYYFNRGICYLQMQQYEKSLMDLRSATERKRDYVKAYDAIGWITYRIGKYDEALEAINTILTLEPNNAEAYYNRAMVYCKKDWISEAIRDARLACDMGYQQACILHDQIKR
jgi:tetratricopeptide (TPR) repeat protein